MVAIENQVYNKKIRSFLMGIAMIFVLLYHISLHIEYINPLSKAITYIFGNGFVGVEMFFLLSAYGLCYSYNSNTLKTFYAHRALRIFPLYPFALILGYVVKRIPFSQAIIDFPQQISGVALFTSAGDHWYMEALVLLYAFFPLLYKVCVWLRKFGFILFLLPFIFHVSLIYISDYALQLFVSRIPIMIIGVMTFIFERDKDYKSLYFMYGGLAMLAFTPILTHGFYFVPASILLISKSFNIIRKCRLVCFIGAHTLEIFLAQVFADNSFGRFSNNYYISLIVFFAITASLAVVFYYLQKYSVILIKRILCLR